MGLIGTYRSAIPHTQHEYRETMIGEQGAKGSDRGGSVKTGNRQHKPGILLHSRKNTACPYTCIRDYPDSDVYYRLAYLAIDRLQLTLAIVKPTVLVVAQSL